MHILKLVERADSRVSTIFNAARKAEKTLSTDARDALERWLSFNWTTGDLSKDFKDGRGGTFAEVYQAFEPVRNEIRRVYGDAVLLYRGMKNNRPREGYDISDNRLYSWTFDEKVADGYAYPNPKWEHRPLSSQQIDALVNRYNQVGFVQYAGRYYKRSKDYPEFYDIYDRNHQFVTDGDDIRKEIEDSESYKQEMIAANAAKGQVAAKRIPVEDIVWLAANSEKEAIVIGHAR